MHRTDECLKSQQKFNRDDVNVIVNARVKAVYPDRVEYEQREADGKKTLYSIPSNFVLWSTGIAMNPFTQRVSNLLPNQVHRKVCLFARRSELIAEDGCRR